jgi:bisphosphoglycerate-independent phosphoglycerate mutase (AlkP superfamily)
VYQSPSLPLLTKRFSYVNTETEKYAHVTFFFNGGVEKQFEGEERHMIDSPKVATYDKLPKMSVQGVADKVAEVVKANKHEFVMCNFAPPDMVRSPFPIPIPSPQTFHVSC